MPRGCGFRGAWFPGYYGAWLGWSSYYWPWLNWWRCRWFPWLPRWWWTGIYGPLTWTPYGPSITSPWSATTSYIPYYPPFYSVTPSKEHEYLLEQKKALEDELKKIENRLKELEESK